MSIKPLGDRVLVKPLDAKIQSIGGIVLPESAQEKNQESEVIALGTGATDENGKKIPFDVKVGDKVLTEMYGGTKIKIDGVEYKIFEQKQIIAIVD